MAAIGSRDFADLGTGAAGFAAAAKDLQATGVKEAYIAAGGTAAQFNQIVKNQVDAANAAALKALGQ